MTSAEIRQSFLDFFHRHQHTIVPSSSLLPDSPGLLFTNAGMNQFVPIFLGDRQPDVSKWAGVRPASDTRAADTQKCIRAGGKHNDLEDVGFDTYHHTMFEMLGNWSFGDYFKKESLTWGWELITKVWGIPPKRLFATVYKPDKAKGDPSEFDQEAYDIWAGLFRAAGLDPAVHIVNGGKKDNFWMMGDTGPAARARKSISTCCPPTTRKPAAALVNAGQPALHRDLEPRFHPVQRERRRHFLAARRQARRHRHGLRARRRHLRHDAASRIFGAEPSNYNADIFAKLFACVEKLSGKTLQGTVPKSREGLSEQENIDVAFRVLADHARCVSCAIADGILPGNEGRNYVVRRILRRGNPLRKKTRPRDRLLRTSSSRPSSNRSAAFSPSSSSSKISSGA
jgi:alanyl-tRNA synthetase